MVQQITIREHLINAIIELSGEELEYKNDLIILAKESEEELIHRILHVARYYKDEYNTA